MVSQQLLPPAAGTGRIAAIELMFATPAIQNLIRAGKTYQSPNMIQTVVKEGMKTMEQEIRDR
ncbi:type IV pilus twitching motility protein PilT [Clostridioides difficile]|uniref:type IV pilus twitching motility protein PilT n=1 Tax=Clostridioides difficile TaxID=1496 RepID=UPI001F4269D0|nr:type IV pilus twitching motility protein PilT [Clostridioides difficile]